MLIHKSSIIALAAASSLAAQQAAIGARCNSAPGQALGITAYTCAICSFKTETGQRTQYTFFAEPLVAEVQRSSPLERGDVILAVDGKPIVTQAGADAFAYPENGKHTVTVRRGRDQKDLDMVLVQNCDWSTGSARGDDGVHAGRGIGVSGRGTASSSSSSGGTGRGVGVPGIGGKPLIVIDGVAIDSNTKTTVGKFGFGIECRPACTLKRTAAGQYYYKYDEPPRIVEIRDRSLAEKAGLELGDLIVKIEGRPITDDAAGIIASEDRQQLRMTIRREGKDIDVLLSVSKSEEVY